MAAAAAGKRMIDERGYRPNVGIVLSNAAGQVFWARRRGHDGWQFPQGGIRTHETPETAMYRELHEEVGLEPAHVELLGRTRDWLRYDIPGEYLRRTGTYKCRERQDAGSDRRTGTDAGGGRRPGAFRGQKQVWFLLRLVGHEQDVRLDVSHKPEFDRWCWIDYWSAVEQIIAFKRDVYRRALAELEPLLRLSQAR